METLNNLIKNLEKNKVSKLIFLGDTFHDDQASERMSHETALLFKRLIKTYKVIFIRGNHDNQLSIDGVVCCEKYVLEGIHFIHEASKENISQVSGHFHPVASLKVNSKKITAKCLVHSENLIILPSYGHYTGGLNIAKSPLREFIDVNSTIYLLSNKSVFKLPVSKIKLL